LGHFHKFLDVIILKFVSSLFCNPFLEEKKKGISTERHIREKNTGLLKHTANRKQNWGTIIPVNITNRNFSIQWIPPTAWCHPEHNSRYSFMSTVAEYIILALYFVKYIYLNHV
jgi:hypothetical protein